MKIEKSDKILDDSTIVTGAQHTEVRITTGYGMTTMEDGARAIKASPVRVGSWYRHYKGTVYTIVSLARDTETLEPVVVYRAMYGTGAVWVRPLGMFVDDVEHNGNKIARFSLQEPPMVAGD